MQEQTTSARGADYAAALTGVMDRAAEIDAAREVRAAPREPLLTRPPVVVALLLIFGGVVYYNILALRPAPLAADSEVLQNTATVSIHIAAQAVEAYRAENGILPTSLEAVGMDWETLDYRTYPDGHFRIGPEEGAVGPVYDSRHSGELMAPQVPRAPRGSR